jgi:hypothetical protein
LNCLAHCYFSQLTFLLQLFSFPRAAGTFEREEILLLRFSPEVVFYGST